MWQKIGVYAMSRTQIRSVGANNKKGHLQAAFLTLDNAITVNQASFQGSEC